LGVVPGSRKSVPRPESVFRNSNNHFTEIPWGVPLRRKLTLRIGALVGLALAAAQERQDDPIPAELVELIFLKCRVSMQELDLDTHHVVVVLAALVRAIVTASAAVDLTLLK
jgi:hypothetical protein